uniref:Reverse transcriptase domain-containing protein n=1 Tax=Leptobrachium leishanense TaxID=445787 RepID=A0A8C5LW51_9ANUR
MNNRGKARNQDFTPAAGRNDRLDNYIEKFRMRVTSLVTTQQQKKIPPNLSPAERMALKNLSSNNNIIIKPADKGGSVVVMNIQDYMAEGDRQLSDVKYYRKLTEDPTKEYKTQLGILIRSFPKHLQQELENLVPSNPRMGTFYMLPKIHKPGNPGRPIITGVDTLTELISGLIEGILKPLVTNTASYIQDTTDFLNKLGDIQTLPADTILVTMDVESLYSNIPHKDGINACLQSLSSHNTPHKYSGDIITKLIEFILTHNCFSFNNNCYLQMTGTAMGSKMSPQYANLFMADLEQRFLNTHPHKPHKYLRYIDDIFIIWTEGEEHLLDFHKAFNMFHPLIKLKMDFSKHSVSFLDCTISAANGTLHSSVYRKPTDRPSYLHNTSFHPNHTKQGIIYSQAIRYHRICSDTGDRDKHLSKLSASFQRKGYKERTISEKIKSALKTPREQLLRYKEKKKHHTDPSSCFLQPNSRGNSQNHQRSAATGHRGRYAQRNIPTAPLTGIQATPKPEAKTGPQQTRSGTG